MEKFQSHASCLVWQMRGVRVNAKSLYGYASVTACHNVVDFTHT